ncbi:MAG: ATP-dependent DNA helicase, partial [Caldilineaceae bacterium]
HAAPINPASLLSKFLFDPQAEGGGAGRRVICTSATLSTAGSFAHFRARCGIISPTIEAVLPPVFDYEQQALLYQPPLPAFEFRSPDVYYIAVAAEIERLLQVSRGRALCLFTSWSGMQHVAQRLTPRGETGLIWPVRCQGDAPREALLAWFRATPHSVLLATRSFWEGVDIPGDDLSLVVLDKLPFPAPNDPLTRARMEELKTAGGDDFSDYMVPMMTLALKQGFGRLIRRTSDRGVVAILDERLTTKVYGRQVRRDLPPARFSRDYKDVHRFFQAAFVSDAECALNLWAWPDEPFSSAAPGAPVGGRWQWQLVRLLDGKASQQAGTYGAPALPDSETAPAGIVPADLAAVEGELLALEHALND